MTRDEATEQGQIVTVQDICKQKPSFNLKPETIAVLEAFCDQKISPSDPELPQICITRMLGAWIGIIRRWALKVAEQNPAFESHLQDSRVSICLHPGLAPLGWTREMVIEQVFRETQISPFLIIRIVEFVEKILHELRGGKAFEPLGWIEDSGQMTHQVFGQLIVRLWPDFLQPMQNGPIEVITGN